MRTRWMSTMAALAVTVPLALAAPAAAAPPAPPRPVLSETELFDPVSGAAGVAGRGDLRADLDALVAAGAVAAIGEARDPAGTWRAAAGVARLDRPGRAPVDGRFRVGSITKTFVATVVLQLAGERRLRLDDPVERWLPGLVPNGSRITLRQLLNHTSGLFNYTDGLDLSPEGWLAMRYRTWRPAELVAVATANPPLFAPGTDWSYSNTNYVLLGMVIQAVTGRGYAAEIRDRIIRPLHLRQTESPGSRLDIAGPHAHGYLPVESDGTVTPVDVTRMNPSIAGAAGDMISSTADLNTFFRALLAGRLLRPAQLAEMQTAVPGHGYGLGLERQTLPCGTTVFGHSGGIFGYATVSLHSADLRYQISVSITPYTGDLGPAADALLSRALCPPA